MEPILLFQGITSLAGNHSDCRHYTSLIIINNAKFLEANGLNISIKLWILRFCRKTNNAAQKDFLISMFLQLKTIYANIK